MSRRHPVSQTVTSQLTLLVVSDRETNSERRGRYQKLTGAAPGHMGQELATGDGAGHAAAPDQPGHRYYTVVSALPPQAGMITASLAASHNSSHVILHPLLPLWKSETQKGISMVRPLLPGQEEDRGSPFCVVVRSRPSFPQKRKGFQTLGRE